MKILITGGSGFIGAYLADYALENSNIVHICDNNLRGVKDAFIDGLISRGSKFIKCDLTKMDEIIKLDKDYDIIFHLAAINGTENFYTIPYDVMRVNILSTMNLLEYFKGCQTKFVYSSSSETYSCTFKFRKDLIPTPETVELCIDDIFNPRYSYGGSKITGELLVANFSHQHDLEFQIIRYNNIYGPRMGFKHVIPQFIKRAYFKEDPFNIYGATQTRSFCYVSDAVRASMNLALSDKKGVFNIGNDKEEMPIMNLAEKVVKYFNYNPKFDIKQPPEGSVQRRCPDLTLLREATGFSPKYNIDEGLKKTISWYSEYYGANPILDSKFL
jgi:nucleoside-diphosphate-sugar epimerase